MPQEIFDRIHDLVFAYTKVVARRREVRINGPPSGTYFAQEIRQYKRHVNNYAINHLFHDPAKNYWYDRISYNIEVSITQTEDGPAVKEPQS